MLFSLEVKPAWRNGLVWCTSYSVVGSSPNWGETVCFSEIVLSLYSFFFLNFLSNYLAKYPFVPFFRINTLP